MDVYTAKAQLEKLLRYVEQLSTEQPRLYEKSKVRWRDISGLCTQVVSVIASMLRDEALSETDSGFESDADAELRRTVQSMRQELDALTRFLPSDSTDRQKVPKEARVAALVDYNRCLRQMQESAQRGSSIEEIATLLYKWFSLRFRQQTSSNKFRYDVSNFKKWTVGFILAYGYHVEAGSVAVFLKDAECWMQTVEDGSNLYAVPKEVHEFSLHPDANKMTLAAVVLYDMLLDAGLCHLVIPDAYDLYLSECAVYDLCNSLNPDVLDRYQNYAAHPEILKELGLRG